MSTYEGWWIRDISMPDGAHQPDDGPPIGVPISVLVNGEPAPFPIFAIEVGETSREAALSVVLTVPSEVFVVDEAALTTAIGGMRCLCPGTPGKFEPEPVYDTAAGTVAVAVYVRSITLGTPPPV